MNKPIDPLLDRAAMALAYDSRRVTRDVDGLVVPQGIVTEQAQRVGQEFGLPRWWLHEQASVYVAAGADQEGARVFDHPGLRVTAASPRHLLAMKVLAGRRRDVEDLITLIKVLGLQNSQQVFEICADVLPQEALPDRSRLIIEDLFCGDAESR